MHNIESPDTTNPSWVTDLHQVQIWPNLALPVDHCISIVFEVLNLLVYIIDHRLPDNQVDLGATGRESEK